MKVRIHITLKTGVLDPQGKAIQTSLGALGFDGVKIDSCGAQKNMTLYASLFNETGKPIVIENCHQGQNFTDGGDPGQMGPGWCPCAPNPLACA